MAEPDSRVKVGARAVAMENVECGHEHKEMSAAKPRKSLPLGDLRRIVLQGFRGYAWRRKSPEKNFRPIRATTPNPAA